MFLHISDEMIPSDCNYLAGKRCIGNLLTYCVNTCRLESLVKVVAGELLGADGILGLRDLVEQPGAFIDTILADVNVLFYRSDGTALDEGGVVEDPALVPDGVQGENFVEGNSENFISEKFPVWLVESLVRPQEMMPEGEPLAFLVDPQSLNPKDVHVVGGDSGVHRLERGIVAFGERGRLDRWTLQWTDHLVRNASMSEMMTFRLASLIGRAVIAVIGFH